MVQLVLLLEPAQDRDRVVDRGLGDVDRLEAPRQRRVLLDPLAVLVERGRADAVQVAARERRLQQVRRVHRPFGRAGADERVHLVDEQHDLALRRGDLGQHRLEPLLELAAELGAGDERAEIERHQALLLEAFGHVAVDDAGGEPLDDRRLADAGLADEHRVVLGPARQHLDGAADLLVAADDRIELAFAGEPGEVAGVLLKRVVAVFRGGRIGFAALAQIVDRGVERLRRQPGVVEDARGRGAGGKRQREQQALGGDEAVARLLGDLAGGFEDTGGFRRKVHLPGARAFDLGQLGELGLDALTRVLGARPGGAHQVRGQALLVVEENREQMFGGESLVPAAQRQPLGGLDEAARALGVFLEIHGFSLQTL